MPFINVFIHFVWSTKNRIPYLENKEIRDALWEHIKYNGRRKDIYIDFVNGYKEHCHCLVSLGGDQTISKVMQLIKGESAFWFNKQNFVKKKLEWQDEYFAASVSYSGIDAVRDYLKNQEEHHQKKTFQQEYDEMIKKFGFQLFKDV